MNNFKTKLLNEKKVSVWGLGYLGYTTILRLQSKGFISLAFDFEEKRLSQIQNGKYPTNAQKESWTKSIEIPNIDLNSLSLCTDYKELFKSNIHVISIPFSEEEKILNLMKIFEKNRDKLKDSLIIFQSAGIPGSIGKLSKSFGIEFFATAFRNDWTLEEFFSENSTRIIAADNITNKEKIEYFFELFGIKTISISSIKEAEILSNANRAISSTINGFLNQLSFAYPETNLIDLSKVLLDNLSINDLRISIGSSRFKEAEANNNLITGTKKEDALSLIKVANSSNLSLLLHYGDLFIKKGYRNVMIYGISGENDSKEIRVSPSVILAEYMNQQGIEVYINDPFFSVEELKNILPFAKNVDLDETVEVDVVIFMTNHRKYNFLNNSLLKDLKIKNSKLIIDNMGIFKNYQFDEKVVYHIPGDGKLAELEE